MSRAFSEIVVEGPFMLVKGFLLGFLSVKNRDSLYFFHRKTGIRRETFKEFLKELFELENYVHLCLESALVDDFVKSSEYYQQTTGMHVKSVKKINSASFSFAYEFYNEEMANKAKALVSDIPSGVKLVDFRPFEGRDMEGAGVEAYAPLHEFTSRAKGTLMGDFQGVVDTYLKIKRSDLSEAIICGEVRLALE